MKYFVLFIVGMTLCLLSTMIIIAVCDYFHLWLIIKFVLSAVSGYYIGKKIAEYMAKKGW